MRCLIEQGSIEAPLSSSLSRDVFHPNEIVTFHQCNAVFFQRSNDLHCSGAICLPQPRRMFYFSLDLAQCLMEWGSLGGDLAFISVGHSPSHAWNHCPFRYVLHLRNMACLRPFYYSAVHEHEPSTIKLRAELVVNLRELASWMSNIIAQTWLFPEAELGNI